MKDNWIKCPLSHLVYVLNGYAFKSKKYVEDGIRVIRIANVQDGYIEDDKPAFYPYETQNEISGYMLDAGDLLMSLTGNVGRVALLTEELLPAALNQRVACLRIKNKKIVDRKFLFYYFRQYSFQKECIDNAKGTAQLNMSTEWLKKYNISLPPLAEQKRIVEQIENLFSKLDEATEKVAQSVENIEGNIESILFEAFSGKLTEFWRKENGLDGTWENTTLSKIVSGLRYGSSEKCDYDNNGTPVLRIPNIGEGIVDFSDLKYMSGELDNISHEVFEDDILIIRSNGSRDLVGRCAIVPKLEQRYAYASFLIKIKVSDRALPKYIVKYINSSMARGQLFAKAKSSSGIHNINSKELGAISINLPTVEEQIQILNIVEPIIDKELNAKNVAEQVLDSIEELKKSVLAKAFRGELGTNIADEESSIELLKSLIEA